MTREKVFHDRHGFAEPNLSVGDRRQEARGVGGHELGIGPAISQVDGMKDVGNSQLLQQPKHPL
jgi:hypothetical protein